MSTPESEALAALAQGAVIPALPLSADHYQFWLTSAHDGWLNPPDATVGWHLALVYGSFDKLPTYRTGASGESITEYHAHPCQMALWVRRKGL